MSLTGIDVSSYQGVIDWPAVKAGGISFAFTKASEGVGWEDPRFAVNWAGIKAANLIRGCYHFGRPENDPLQDARYFLGVIGQVDATDLLALDLEQSPVPYDDLSGWALEWLNYVHQQTGHFPFWYSYPSFIEAHSLTALFTSPYPAWLVNPLSTWPLQMLQLLSGGSVPGIPGTVDIDDWAGDLNGLAVVTVVGNGGILPVKATVTTGGSESSVAIIAHPTQAGRYDVLVVGTDSAVWHAFGDLVQLTTATWESFGGVAMPGTLSATWTPDGSVLAMQIVGSDTKPYVKEINLDGSIKNDWNALRNGNALTVAAGPPGKDGVSPDPAAIAAHLKVVAVP